MSSKLINSEKWSTNNDPDFYCHKCKTLIVEEQLYIRMFGVYFHEGCFNRYEHYYGLDKPID